MGKNLEKVLALLGVCAMLVLIWKTQIELVLKG